MSRYTKSYLLSRLAIGASMFGHGLVRLPKLPVFSNWMVGLFQAHKSILPSAVVTPFSYILPIAEFVIGLLLLIGLFTEKALIAGAIVMILLIFGSTTIEEWDAIPSQLIHVVFFALLLIFIENNSYALDTASRKKQD
jgi:thiosulfate dehydrogenase [quinone] large subunit